MTDAERQLVDSFIHSCSSKASGLVREALRPLLIGILFWIDTLARPVHEPYTEAKLEVVANMDNVYVCVSYHTEQRRMWDPAVKQLMEKNILS